MKASEKYGEKIDIEIGSDLYHMINGTKSSYVFAELKRFQEDRLLNVQTFDLKLATMNILEELLEAHGVSDNKNRVLASKAYDMIDGISKHVYKLKLYDEELGGCDFNTPTIKQQVDAFCDIQVFADGEVGKLGYDNEKCMSEVAKEINSRTGEIIDGKFTKYKTPEAIAKWYKADFSGCKNVG